MSNLFLSLILALLLPFNGSIVKEVKAPSPPVKKSIDVTFTSNEGCIVTVKGVIDFDIWSMSLNSFTGTVTLSGGADGCPTGVLTFGMVSSGNDFTISLDDNNPCNASSITWTGNNNQVEQILNQSNSQSVILAELITETGC